MTDRRTKRDLRIEADAWEEVAHLCRRLGWVGSSLDSVLIFIQGLHCDARRFQRMMTYISPEKVYEYVDQDSPGPQEEDHEIETDIQLHEEEADGLQLRNAQPTSIGQVSK